MSIHRYASKRDGNEKAIIEALELVGASVLQLSVKGAPDLLVCHRNRLYLMEVKTAKGKLTPDQQEFHRQWMGEIHIVRTVDEALGVLGLTC